MSHDERGGVSFLLHIAKFTDLQQNMKTPKVVFLKYPFTRDLC